MKTLIIAAAVALLSATASASPVEKWAGSGSEYSPDGTPLTTYQISVVNTETAANVVQSVATITAADGSQKTVTQTLTMNGANWSDDSNLGKGSGACYGGNICENYIAGDIGAAYATTIISDGPNARRDLTIVLQNGAAVKVLRENLTRVN